MSGGQIPIQAGGRLRIVDVAPTIAHILGIEAPSGAKGRVRHELQN